MRYYSLFCLAILLTLGAAGQELKYYLNGSNVKDSTFEDFKNGDLLRVVFSNKTVPYNFRIATLMVTLTPVKQVGNEVTGQTVSFLLDNTTDIYTSSPSITIDLFSRLTLLQYNEYDITVRVKHLIADTPEGNNWIKENITFEEVPIRKRLPGAAK